MTLSYHQLSSSPALPKERNKTLREQRSKALLKWYDRHARVMPWRVGPAERKAGQRPNPYHVWLSEVMLQQTTVAAVRDYFRAFLVRWPTVDDLAAAKDDDVMAAWAGLGYYARARNLLACARVVSIERGGVFPGDLAELQSLPGIGPYTAAAIAAIAFDQPETVVDGNVERVMARLFSVKDPMPGAKTQIWNLAKTMTPQDRPGDYAQAVMDLGATICTPRSPACGICPLIETCLAHKLGIAAELPVKPPKKVKPVKRATFYIGRTANGAWLMERRPARGLLGGTLGWPGSDWTVDPPEPKPPVWTAWQEFGAEFRHTFTHFHLDVGIFVGLIDAAAVTPELLLLDVDQFVPNDLPTLMRKAFEIAQPWEGWLALQQPRATVE